MLRGLGEEGATAARRQARATIEEPQLRDAAARAKATLDASEQALRQATTALAEARAERGRLDGEKVEIEGRAARLAGAGGRA